MSLYEKKTNESTDFTNFLDAFLTKAEKESSANFEQLLHYNSKQDSNKTESGYDDKPETRSRSRRHEKRNNSRSRSRSPRHQKYKSSYERSNSHSRSSKHVRRNEKRSPSRSCSSVNRSVHSYDNIDHLQTFGDRIPNPIPYSKKKEECGIVAANAAQHEQLVFEDTSGRKMMKVAMKEPQKQILQFLYKIIHFAILNQLQMQQKNSSEFPLMEFQEMLNKLDFDVRMLMSSLSKNQKKQLSETFMPDLKLIQEKILNLLTKSGKPIESQNTIVCYLNIIGSLLSMHQMLHDQFNLNLVNLKEIGLYKSTIPCMFEQNGQKCTKPSCTYLHTLH
jgi:hypothetical protein